MPEPRPPLPGLNWPRGLTLTIAVASVLGCQLVFGDFEFQPVENGGGGGGSSTTAVPNGESCAQVDVGTRRCNGDQPEVCQDGFWTNNGVACSDLPCVYATGDCAVCGGGRKRCNSGNLETCRADGSGWDTTKVCDSPTYCHVSKLDCVMCEAEETKCAPDNKALLTCRTDQLGFDSVTCSHGPCVVASVGTDFCQQCVPGQPAACTSDNRLLTCSDQGALLSKQCPGSCVQINTTVSGSCQ